MSDAYSANKLVFHPDWVEAFRTRTSHKKFPTFVHLMLNNSCNHGCAFCSYRLVHGHNSEQFDAKSKISKERLDTLIQELIDEGVRAVELTGGGEPTLHPELPNVIEKLSRAGVKTALVTNGSVLTPEQCQEYPKHLTWMRVSVDAGDPDTYRYIRRSRDWNRVWINIHRLVENKEDMTLGLSFVISERNYKELQTFCYLAKEACVDNVRISVAFTLKGRSIITDEMLEHITRNLTIVKKKYPTLKIYDMSLERIDNMEQFPQHTYCGIKDLICVIEGQCHVYTCCTLTGSPRGFVGNIGAKTLRQLWSETEDFRKRFSVSKNCRCPCLYTSRNDFIDQLRNPPDHLEFI